MEPDTVYRRVGDIGMPDLPIPVDPVPPPTVVPVELLFPPTDGISHAPLTLMDVFNLGRAYRDARYSVSGASAGGYSGSSVNVYAAW